MSFRKPAPAASRVIFGADSVNKHLRALKAAAETTPVADGQFYWSPALKFDFQTVRKGANGTLWISVFYTNEQGVNGRLNLSVHGERHTGQIMPSTEAGVAALVERVRSKNPSIAAKIEMRTKQPSIQIQKYSVPVKTAEDGYSMLTDEAGLPVLPGDDKLSAYFQVAEILHEAFTTEVKSRIDRGLGLVARAAEMKRADKNVTAQAILDAYFGGRPRPMNDIIMSSDSSNQLRRTVAAGADALTKGAIVTGNVKIVDIVQEFISNQAARNAGQALINPITRVQIKFDGTTGVPACRIYDKNAPYMAEGKQKYDIAKVDGVPVNSENVHEFINSGCLFDGIIAADSVCVSNMGLSMPIKAEIAVFEQPVSRSAPLSLDDLYDEGFEVCAELGNLQIGGASAVAGGASAVAGGASAVAGGAPAGGAPAGGASAVAGGAPSSAARLAAGHAAGAPALTTAAAAIDDSTYDELLGELSGK